MSDQKKENTSTPSINYKDLLEFLPEVVFETDLKLNLIYANEIGFEKFGFSKEDIWIKYDNGVLSIGAEIAIPEVEADAPVPKSNVIFDNLKEDTEIIRKIDLPEDANVKNAEAILKNGILEIKFPIIPEEDTSVSIDIS